MKDAVTGCPGGNDSCSCGDVRARLDVGSLAALSDTGRSPAGEGAGRVTAWRRARGAGTYWSLWEAQQQRDSHLVFAVLFLWCILVSASYCISPPSPFGRTVSCGDASGACSFAWSRTRFDGVQKCSCGSGCTCGK
ncbi:hypothetical protein I4F81_007958 [Pyropia yezoensis]|uniref:Uncharacterized protein n=1 Tax=Pyropia yezoensis TaxID=2788 RepID=A0ACC3C5J0_PYRYE|nr:hypothetical protein I4F81_007958 [Neopyropia yezoensis]